MPIPITNDPQLNSAAQTMQQVAQRIIEREREAEWEALVRTRKLTLRERWCRLRGRMAPSK